MLFRSAEEAAAAAEVAAAEAAEAVAAELAARVQKARAERGGTQPTAEQGGTQPTGFEHQLADEPPKEEEEAPLPSVAAAPTWELSQDHQSLVVISDQHRLVYIDVPKAASTAIRLGLSQLKASALCSGGSWAEHASGACCAEGRKITTTECLTQAHLDEYFIFSFSRHPVDKFESAVRQFWLQQEKRNIYDQISAADELKKQQQDLTQRLRSELSFFSVEEVERRTADSFAEHKLRADTMEEKATKDLPLPRRCML